jgi:hypothetical protein
MTFRIHDAENLVCRGACGVEFECTFCVSNPSIIVEKGRPLGAIESFESRFQNGNFRAVVREDVRFSLESDCRLQGAHYEDCQYRAERRADAQRWIACMPL